MAVSADAGSSTRRREPWFRAAQAVLLPPLDLWFNWRYEGTEQIPAEGPMLVACNHISYFDAFAIARMLIPRGRRPRFLAKIELFKNPFLRVVLKGARQIPVVRGAGSPAALDAAVGALRSGEAVVVFPEGTTTHDPDFRQGPSKTGIARLSFATGVPVTPMAIWGSHRIWTRQGVSSMAFGRPVWVKVGSPMTFPGHAGSEDQAVSRIVTDEIMATIAEMTGDLRARYPERWQ